MAQPKKKMSEYNQRVLDVFDELVGAQDSKLEKGHIVTLLTSYCGDDSKNCTARRPCADCIAMCNQFRLLDGASVKYLQQVGSQPKGGD